MNILPNQTRVSLIYVQPASDEVRKENQGMIVGHGFMTRADGFLTLMYLVQFNGGGFYNPSHTIYINILPIHHSNLEVLP